MEIWRKELYLEHHGILGMHWGIRRYQNPDGSLTEAGRKRIIKLNKKMNKLRGSQVTVKQELKPHDKIRLSDREVKKEIKKMKDKKYISKLSDDEIIDRMNRINLENQYKQTLGIPTSKDKGLSGILKDSIKAFVPTAVSIAGSKYINNKLDAKNKIRLNEIQQKYDKINEDRRLANTLKEITQKNILQLEFNQKDRLNQANINLAFNKQDNINRKNIDNYFNNLNAQRNAKTDFVKEFNKYFFDQQRQTWKKK